MNPDAAKEMREFCQKWLVELQSKNHSDEDSMKTIIVLLDQMHKRLTLLEGIDLRSLDKTTF